MRYDWHLCEAYDVALVARGPSVVGRANGQVLFEVRDEGVLTRGAIALLVEEGRLSASNIEGAPISETMLFKKVYSSIAGSGIGDSMGHAVETIHYGDKGQP